MAAGPAAHATPINSGGPGARAACRARPCGYRRAAARHGRERPGDRRAGEHLAAPAGPGPAPRRRLARGEVSGPDAAQVITAFSRPGELVVIPAAGTGVLLAAAAAAGRRVLGLVPGPAACHAAGLRAWTGTWTRRGARWPQVRPGGPALLLEPGCPEAGQAALAITGAPGGPRRRRVLYAACERVLRPGGVLAVITAAAPARRAARRPRRGRRRRPRRRAGLRPAHRPGPRRHRRRPPRPRRPRRRPGSRARRQPASTATCSCSPSPEETRP